MSAVVSPVRQNGNTLYGEWNGQKYQWRDRPALEYLEWSKVCSPEIQRRENAGEPLPASRLITKASVVTGKDPDECDAAYGLTALAGLAVYNVVYRRRRGPTFTWQVPLLGFPGVDLKIRPLFEPVAFKNERYPEGSDDIKWDVGSSNWVPTMYFDVALWDIHQAAKRIYSGWFSVEDFTYTFTNGPQEITQAVCDTAYAFSHGTLPLAHDYCAFCQKPLADEGSRNAGYGRDCAKRYGLKLPTSHLRLVGPQA